MTLKEFTKIQKKNYVLAIFGGIVCILGLTNASYNKGVIAGAEKMNDYINNENRYSESTK